MKYIIVCVIMLLLAVVIVGYSRDEYEETQDICRGVLTDKEYLNHMIPHHQVAIDISMMLQKKTKNPKMQDIVRKLLWTQNYEISMMRDLLKNTPEDYIDADDAPINKSYLITRGDLTEPNTVGVSNTYCDPHFFAPEEHADHMKHMKLTDETYIKHMIPHHQVAVDMSKVLLENTTNTYMIHLAYRIIRSQQSEIVLLKDMLENKYHVSSNMLS